MTDNTNSTNSKKALPVCLLRVLEKHATAERPLTTRMLTEHMREDYGLEFERKAVGRNLLLLSEMGFPLSSYQDNGKGYYLKHAVDAHGAVLDEKERDVVLDALLHAPRFLASERVTARFQSEPPVYMADERELLGDDTVFDKLSCVREAINLERQISFFNAGGKAEIYGSPYAIIFAGGHYYLLLSVQGYGKLLRQRCDQIKNVSVTDKPLRPVTELVGCEGGLDIGEYLKNNLARTDERFDFSLLCKPHLHGEALLAFGAETQFEIEGDCLRVTATADKARIRKFVLEHLRYTVLVAPANIAAELAEDLRHAAACYAN